MINYRKWALSFCVISLSACGDLPLSGPSGKKVVALGGRQATVAVPEVELIDLDEGTLPARFTSKVISRLPSLAKGGLLWARCRRCVGHHHLEAPPAGVVGGSLTSSGSGSAQLTKLPEQMVSERGTVSIPFVGDVQVSGKTPGQIQGNH